MRKIILLLLLTPLFTASQKLPTIEEKTKDLKKFEGFFNFYWDENTGKIWLEVDIIDREIIYTVSFTAGLGPNDICLLRWFAGGGRILIIFTTGRKILIDSPNY